MQTIKFGKIRAGQKRRDWTASGYGRLVHRISEGITYHPMGEFPRGAWLRHNA